jgi:hypothetical protein
VENTEAQSPKIEKDMTSFERLRTLYAVLDGIPDRKLKLNSWRNYRGEAWGQHPDDVLFYECNTTACAVGWACAYPPFKEQGLSFTGGPRYREEESSHEVYTDWEAVEEFFSLTSDEATDIFHPFYSNTSLPLRDGEYSGPRALTDKEMVMRRILKFLHLKGAITFERLQEKLKEKGLPA